MARIPAPRDGGAVSATRFQVQDRLPEGLALVERVIEIALHFPGRLIDSKGRPGGLVELPSSLRPIIIGDLHANVHHLQRILAHGHNEADIASGKAYAIIVGDTVHDDRTGSMKEMSNSVAMLDEVFALMARYPGRIYYIRGNHDTFDERLRKSGIAQGTEFRKTLLAAKGAEFVAAVERFFEALPQFAIGEGFVITHAGPPRGGCGRKELIEIADHPDIAMQLMWNRINEFHGTPSPKEYGEADLRKMLELLGLPETTPFIVGHNPLWGDGGTTGVWLDVIGIKNHHIIYSGSGSRGPYFTFQDGKLIVAFAVDREPEVYYYG